MSRELTPGLKELILHLSDTVEERTGDASMADNWTRLTLELHGILSGGMPFHSSEQLLDLLDIENQVLDDSDRLQVVTKEVEVDIIADEELIRITPKALVMGGGISGMTAAINIASQGFEVILIEKEEYLGGNLKNLNIVSPTLSEVQHF